MMPTLKKTINRYLLLLASITSAVMLVIIVGTQFVSERKNAYEASVKTLSRIERVLEENGRELSEIQQEYRQTCLNNAETIVRIIEGAPDVIDDVDELKEIARITGVDEIHFFDGTGRIFAGTHPEYYNYTFESGEQMGFFKPLLEDKTLGLVQDITPNTAEGKLMQYSALWNRTGDIIVQVGMEPVNVMKATEKNELSYIFSLFQVDPGASYYAIDGSGEIVGSTSADSVGKLARDVGLSMEKVRNKSNGFFARLDGETNRSYCVFELAGDVYLGRAVSERELYRLIPATALLLVVCLTALMAIMFQAISVYINKFVVQKIQAVNEELQQIAQGNLDKTIDVQSSLEFSELSKYLNIMIKSLLDENKKMTYVLSKTNLYIGVYEYNGRMRKVRYAGHLPRLLALSDAEMEKICSDYSLFKARMREICAHPVPGEPGVFRISERPDQYIKLESIEEHDEILGVVIDVTEDVLRRRKIELERDADPLTGLYNRRGMDSRVDAQFQAPEQLGHSAFVMIDADGLKAVNDTYGHEKGDIYLRKIAQLIRDFEPGHSMAARQGGDEFILFLYRYGEKGELLRALKALEEMQDRELAQLDEDLCVPMRFSLGYCVTRPDTSYHELIREADEQMYQNKRWRKTERV